MSGSAEPDSRPKGVGPGWVPCLNIALHGSASRLATLIRAARRLVAPPEDLSRAGVADLAVGRGSSAATPR